MQFYSKYSSSKICLPLEKHYLFLDGIWNLIGTVEQNHSNQLINQDNLEYQRERNKIEDARYEEETEYNRAWAEENRDYERALQQTLFDREDTAIQRQAEALSSMGINPASQQLNGLGAGQALSPSTAPTASAQDSDPLHSDYRKENVLSSMVQGMQGGLSSLVSLADTMNGLQTGIEQRDALKLQNDAKYLQNLKDAHNLGLDYTLIYNGKNKRNVSTVRNTTDENGYPISESYGSVTSTPEYLESKGNYFRSEELKKEESEFKRRNKLFSYDSNPTNYLNLLSSDDVYTSAEKALTKASHLFDNVTEKLGNESIYDLGKMNNKFNLAQFLKSLFF